MDGNQTYLEYTAPLTAEERRTLKKGFGFIGFFTIVCIGVFSFGYFIIRDMEDDWDNWPIWIGAAFACIFAAVIVYQIFIIAQDLSAGEAEVLSGRISEKNLYEATKGDKDPSPTYFLTFGDREVQVNEGQYNQVNEGDHVEIRSAPHSKEIFSITTIEKGPEPEEAPKERFPSHEETYTLRLMDSDIEKLRTRFRRTMIYRIAMVVVTGYFFIPFVRLELWGIVLMLSPLVVIFLYQLIAIVVTLRRYRRDMESGTKIGTSVPVTDKQIIRGSNTRYRVYTETGRVDVSHIVYASVSVGDRVTVCRGKHTGWVLGVE